MSTVTEAEWKFFGPEAVVKSVFAGLTDGSEIREKKKRKFYADTPDWQIFGLRYYFRNQVYREKSPRDFKRLTDEGTIAERVGDNSAFWRGTLKSDGAVCSQQGLVKLEAQTGYLRRPAILRDVVDPGLRSIFDHVADAELSEVFVTKEKRQVAEVAIAEDGVATVSVELIKAKFLIDGKEFVAHLIEVENNENSCSSEQVEEFVALLNSDDRLRFVPRSMADIGYSLSCRTNTQKELMAERYVDVTEIPGFVYKDEVPADFDAPTAKAA